MGFPGGSDGKEAACSVGDLGSIPWRRERLPTPVFWPGELHGLYSPWGHKESDMTERLSLHFTVDVVILSVQVVNLTFFHVSLPSPYL